MGAFLNFANNVQRLSLKRGRPPKFNANQFYPRHLERALKEATAKEFMRVFEQFKKAALQGFTDDIKELSNENATVSTEFAGELDRIANEIVANAQNNLVKFSEMTIGKPYYPTGLENTIKENWTATFQALCISAETDAKAKIAAALSKAHDLGCNKYQTEKLVEELLPKLTKHRAELISRTETGKLNNAATMATYKGAGIEYYKWLSCIDDRTRPTHAALNNCICAVGDPESYFEENEADPLHPIKHARTSGMYIGEPGTDFQCRCSCIPWDPEIDGMYEVKEQKPEVKTPEQVAKSERLSGTTQYSENEFSKEQRKFFESLYTPDKNKETEIIKKAKSNKYAFPTMNSLETPAQSLALANSKAEKNEYGEITPKWVGNCQRCILAYEARRRGFNVFATSSFENDILAKKNNPDLWTLMFKNANQINIYEYSPFAIENTIIKALENFGNGARVMIRFERKFGAEGHLFVGENVNGNIFFIDPQTNKFHNSEIFSGQKKKSFAYTRVDNLEFSDKIKLAF